MNNVTRQEAIAAVKAQAFKLSSDGHPNGDPGLLGQYPGGVVHCLRAGIGADWSAEGVVALIEGAQEIWWEPNSFLDHDLVVLAEGDGTAKLGEYRFQVKAPDKED